MNSFTYRYPVTVYFGEKAAEKNLETELAKVGKTVLLAYGGGSIKKNGVYDELTGILKAAGKEIIPYEKKKDFGDFVLDWWAWILLILFGIGFVVYMKYWY